MKIRQLAGTTRLLGREHGLRGVSPLATARTLAGAFAARRRLVGESRLHLGCGEHLLDGWANVDLIGFPGVVPWNLAEPLPVADGSIDFIFSEHFIEHIPLEAGRKHFADCHRVLRPGGVLRLSTPDLGTLFHEYTAGRTDEWADVQWQPRTPCQMVNEGMRLWGHEFLYDFEELSTQLRSVGFQEVKQVGWQQSQHPQLRNLELRPFHGEVILEATR